MKDTFNMIDCFFLSASGVICQILVHMSFDYYPIFILFLLLQILPVEDPKNSVIHVILHGSVASHIQYVIKTLGNVSVTSGFQQQIISISAENVSIIGKSCSFFVLKEMCHDRFKFMIIDVIILMTCYFAL